MQKILINAAVLMQIAPTLPPKMAGVLAPMFNELGPKYGVINRDIFEEYIATCAHECQEFTKLEENLRYSAAGLMKTWPKRFPEVMAKQAAGKPKLIAMIAYGKRRDLGNVTAEDGWIFRGGGPIQITGGAMYKAWTAFYNKREGTNYTPEQMAELVRTDWRIAIDCSFWVFCIAKGLIDEAIADKFSLISERINGGKIGMDSRMVYYNRALKYLPLVA